MKTPERANPDNAPWEILEMLMHPYRYYGELLGDKSKSVLDIAAGDNMQRLILEKHFEYVTSMDIRPSPEEKVIEGDVLDIPLPDESVDVTLCFETIEHVEDHQRVVSELTRVTRKGGTIVVGSISKNGPTHLGDVVIFKGDLNPYHLKELSSTDFGLLFGSSAKFHRSHYQDGLFRMKRGLSTEGICNYAMIEREK